MIGRLFNITVTTVRTMNSEDFARQNNQNVRDNELRIGRIRRQKEKQKLPSVSEQKQLYTASPNMSCRSSWVNLTASSEMTIVLSCD